jgi:hypothetical protein
VAAPRGVKVVRVDSTTGATSDFITNAIPGEASKHGLGGLEHPSDVTFGPDGAMYIADWGLARISTDGLKLDPGSGVVWRVVAATDAKAGGVAGGLVIEGALLIIVLVGALRLAWQCGRHRLESIRGAAVAGIAAGLVMGVFMMAVVSTVLTLPWYAAPRVLATMVMGRAAVADILSFDLVSFVLGLIVLVLLSAVLGIVLGLLLRRGGPAGVAAGFVYGLAVWAALQFFVLPFAFPLVSDKGFPPMWYAVSFGLFGLVLGLILVVIGRLAGPPWTVGRRNANRPS